MRTPNNLAGAKNAVEKGSDLFGRSVCDPCGERRSVCWTSGGTSRSYGSVLQDFDKIGPSNDSTSLLSLLEAVGRRKARVVGEWLDRIGFQTFLEERRFSPLTRRSDQEPGVALCGVDNGEARVALEDAGFDLIVEIGLGGGPESFRSIALHTFPATRKAREIWSKSVLEASADYDTLPAYTALKEAGLDECGLAQLASRAVGVPFVGLIAACLAVSELTRRLNGGVSLEFAAGSVAALEFEVGTSETSAYAHGYVEAVASQLGGPG